ncbi:glycosyltransferase family 4 protein [Aureisphaera sp. CAU 1614]|uniref:Glycosyltransferase family 4 protein n=1 Tax=Halomarinibacterium sedimenti TaxID=2857106 RepID=A0A9X1JYZ0_9FLAO|nr:glycosyltransferase family 4 protein [Halomarinibacterium sedimenti]MBW2938012.1 glycosyltransferase family 4 protein [Halomarinibacterium sedimenti]
MKRVLIICYYWPPAGGPGVQRWLKFVKYFRNFEVEPVLFIPKNPHYPIIDESLLAEIPKDLEIIRHPIKEPYKYARLLSKKKTKKISSGIIDEKKPSVIEKLLLYARGNLFIPDARIGWVAPSVKVLTKYLSENKDIDTLITTGPPHSLHLIGMELKEQLKLKWIADFRDPWTTIHYHKSLRLSKSAQKKHEKLEKEVLQAADLVVVTSPTTQQDFRELTSKPVEVITNGFDTSENKEVVLDSKFSLVHIGSLLSNRNPKLLWKVLSELKNEVNGFSNDLELKLVGLVSKDVKEEIQKYHLSENVVLPGYVSHQEAISFQNSAQVLLLIEMNKEETSAIIPGKLFEYLRSKRPIVAIVPEKSDIEGILKETKAGEYFTYTNEVALKKSIAEKYNRYKSGKLAVTKSSIDGYSRKSLTQKMAALLKDLKSETPT